MKKLLILSLALPTILTLSSCTINWFDGESYTVPWYLSLLILSVLIAPSLALIFYSVASDYRRCPKCQHRFKPKWYKSFGAIFIGEKTNSQSEARLFKCPKCKYKGLMNASYDQDEPHKETDE